MSSKVVEADAGVHSLAMAVAVGPSLVFLSRLSLTTVDLSARHKLAIIR